MGRLTADSPEAKQKMVESLTTYFFPKSKFEFVNSSYSFRPKEWHLLLGSQGKGKSTLSRSLLFELAQNGVKVLYYSTEETEHQFKTMCYLAQLQDAHLENIYFVHDKDMFTKAGDDLELWETFFVAELVRSGAQIVFFDNITTSRFYGNKHVEEQGKFADQLKEICQRGERPFFIVAHTKKGVMDSSSQEITGQDIRGNANVSNMSENLLVFRMIKETTPEGKFRRHAFIYIDKGRFNKGMGRHFKLMYDMESRTYVGDTAIDFNKVKEAFQRQEKLGGR